MQKILFLFLACAFISCNQQVDKSDKSEKEKWKSEILKAEADFENMAQEKSIPEAFIAYAADDVAILRNNKVIEDKKALSDFYNGDNYENVSLHWKPDFVDVSASGDLGYTYGKYVYKITDSLGKQQVHEGIFHTVWKRQSGGEWKFVWD